MLMINKPLTPGQRLSKGVVAIMGNTRYVVGHGGRIPC